MSDPISDDYGMELVMPFVACTSQGGPYDDAAFVAGFRAATIEQTLVTGPTDRGWSYVTAVEPALLPQLDLIAMQHGWQTTHKPWAEHPDEWTIVRFSRTGEVADDAEDAA